MTQSGEDSSFEEGSKDRGDAKSSFAPSSSLALDAHANQWCIEGMDDIFREGMQPKV